MSSGVSDEAVEAGAQGYWDYNRDAEHYPDAEETWGVLAAKSGDEAQVYRDAARSVLEAAAPLMGATSVCNCPTDADVTPDMRTETGQHLTGCPTLGVQPQVVASRPTREQVWRAAYNAIVTTDALMSPGFSARVEADADDVTEALVDAVLALMGGAE